MKKERVLLGDNGASSPYTPTAITPTPVGDVAGLADDPGLLICRHEHRIHYLGGGGAGGAGGIWVCFACWAKLIVGGRKTP
jgi:hypothetical protein